MAVRHFSSPPNSPRKVLPSRLLTTLDQEIDKMSVEDPGKATIPSEPYSRTMGMAMGSAGDRSMGDRSREPPVPGTS